MKKEVGLIVAMTTRGIIGSTANTDPSGLLWDLKDDFSDFQKKTTEDDGIVILGRKTADILRGMKTPKGNAIFPLKGRFCIVITSTECWGHAIADEKQQHFAVAADHLAAMSIAQRRAEGKTVWIIGGAELYKSCLESFVIDRFSITTVEEDPGHAIEGDIVFPQELLSRQSIFTNFANSHCSSFSKNERNSHNFTIADYQRIL